MCFRDLTNKVTVGDEWWRYTINFGKECVNRRAFDLEGCREKIYDEQDISLETLRSVDNAMKDSFVESSASTQLEYSKEDNYKLQTELQLQEEMHVDHYPALYVNKERYTVIFVYLIILTL